MGGSGVSTDSKCSSLLAECSERRNHELRKLVRVHFPRSMLLDVQVDGAVEVGGVLEDDLGIPGDLDGLGNLGDLDIPDDLGGQDDLDGPDEGNRRMRMHLTDPLELRNRHSLDRLRKQSQSLVVS